MRKFGKISREKIFYPYILTALAKPDSTKLTTIFQCSGKILPLYDTKTKKLKLSQYSQKILKILQKS
jgi:hypothetical protein